MGGFPLLLSLIALCGSGENGVAACTCVPGPALTNRRVVREAAASYDAVFEGMIVKVTYVRAPRPPPEGVFPVDEAVATVALTRRWRGRGADTVVVRTDLQTTACGLPFREGDRYLLFVREGTSGAFADRCGPSRLWDEKAERLAKLLGPENRVH